MRRIGLAILVAALTAAAGGAQAQNIFELLFGIKPSRPPQQPPAYQRPEPAPPPEMPFDEPRRPSAPAGPALPRVGSVKAPSEDSVLGRDLKQNGSNGSLRIERTSRGDLRVRMTLVGRRSAQSVETCTIPLAGGDGAPLVAQGRPEGAPRYQLQDPTCPLQFDILDEAVLIKGPSDICVFQSVSCQADPSGMWGPEPAQLMPKVRDYEAMRASADRIVRDNYKVLASRARPENARPIIAEQAAFSSDREMMCRSYAREGTTSFCNAKFTEARALSLATRLGIGVSTASAEPRPRRRQQTDPYALPSTDELMQRQPGED
ncbi:hypothetical protein [Enterovirga aerilata]|uniref:hypothetical protein n=1 Tax=Enterovirga aerilata TaxID=2730920 RepID=UPI00158141E1|nr:hypothetical protein [Enterovirga sp. DB1703]